MTRNYNQKLFLDDNNAIGKCQIGGEKKTPNK